MAYCPTGIDTVQEEQETVAPLDMAVEFKIMSVPEVPALPSMTAVTPSDLNARKNVHTPVATAVADPIALAVLVPPDDAPNAVAPRVSVASRVLPDRAVSGVAGCVPV